MPFFILACAENFSNGERIGFITKFSKKGAIWKSWEVTLNLTQTGMNTASTEELSIDNDKEEQYGSMIQTLDSAVKYGWKVKLVYHEVWGCKNVCKNRGESDRFINEVIVLDRTPMNIFNGNSTTTDITTEKPKDTLIVIIKDFDTLLQILKNRNK